MDAQAKERITETEYKAKSTAVTEIMNSENNYKTQFIDNGLRSGALKFGEFTLKSGSCLALLF